MLLADDVCDTAERVLFVRVESRVVRPVRSRARTVLRRYSFLRIRLWIDHGERSNMFWFRREQAIQFGPVTSVR